MTRIASFSVASVVADGPEAGAVGVVAVGVDLDVGLDHRVGAVPSSAGSRRMQNRCWWMGEVTRGPTWGEVSKSVPSCRADTPTMPVSLTSSWIVPS